MSQIANLLPRDVGDHIEKVNKQFTNDEEIFYWMYTEGIHESQSIKRYLFFLSTMSRIFQEINIYFEETNQGRENKKDYRSVQTTPEEMLLISQYLYYLDSYGIGGDVLECGCFKGYSSCCLSWACDFLGRKLIVADSFEGLPAIKHCCYETGDFKESMENVKKNVKTLGKIKNVEFIKGWFSKSLLNFDRQICLLWMDVDLYGSAQDVLNGVFQRLTHGGVIFSHEFNPSQIENGLIKQNSNQEVMKAIGNFMNNNNVHYKTCYVTGFMGLVVPNIDMPKYKLIETVMGMQDALNPSIISSLAKVNANMQYSVDLIRVMPENKILEIEGWAVDDVLKDSARGVIINIDGNFFSTTYGFERRDVAIAHRNIKYTYSGFKARIDVSYLEYGKHHLSLLMVSKNKTNYVESQKVNFIIKNPL